MSLILTFGTSKNKLIYPRNLTQYFVITRLEGQKGKHWPNGQEVHKPNHKRLKLPFWERLSSFDTHHKRLRLKSGNKSGTEIAKNT